jgi:hypothetical protein
VQGKPADTTKCEAALVKSFQKAEDKADGAGLPATGQTTAYTAIRNNGVPSSVAVPDDGTVRAGAALAYTDDGDGTITDVNTGLTWEKKGDGGGLHDQHGAYVWTGDDKSFPKPVRAVRGGS